jgi:hypothetical protein
VRRIAAIGVLAAVAAGAYVVALPPRAPVPAGQNESTLVTGAIHVHTVRSDGTGSADGIAAAAARAGLDFVVFTDHGDGTRKPDAPQYRSGVLCIDSVEISTRGGHVVALGLPQAPYPLGGEARDVVDDVIRLGGFPIAAHPGSPKPELTWSDWSLPVSGVEWLNADSEWRDESRWTLTKALLTYPARRTETLTTLLDRPDSVIEQWDTLSRDRPVVAIAGTDAHARLGFPSLSEPYEAGASLHVPSYERLFRVFANVLPGISLTGDAAADADLVIAAVRRGHLYTAIDGLHGTGTLSFTATDGSTRAEPGDVVSSLREWTLSVELGGPADAVIQLFRDGVRTNESSMRLTHMIDIGSRGAYRVEVSLPGAPGQPPIPWLLSNPIYVGERPTLTTPAAVPRASNFEVRYGDGPAAGWTIETSAASKAALDVVAMERGTQLALRYAIGGAASESPYAAFVLPADASIAQYDRLIFTGRADRPTRVSVQLRQPDSADGQRWHRSVLMDTEPKEITVFFNDLRPIGGAAPQPALTAVDSILFVLDTVNTRLGGNGRIWIDDVKYGK